MVLFFIIKKTRVNKEERGMAYEQFKIRITRHGHAQYCSRVEEVEIDELAVMCRNQLNDHDYDYNYRSYLHLAGVWWVYTIDGDEMAFITCYGRTNFDIPKALGWAAANRDRIMLDPISEEQHAD